MTVWKMLTFLGVVLIVITVFCGMVLPVFINKPFFFMFRRSERKLLEAEQDFDETMTEVATDRIRKGVDLIEDQTKYNEEPTEKKEQ